MNYSRLEILEQEYSDLKDGDPEILAEWEMHYLDEFRELAYQEYLVKTYENPMNINEKFEIHAKPVRQFLSTIEYSQALITGGLIRDLVLDYPPRDTDVVIRSDLTNEQLESLTGGPLIGYTSYGNDMNHFKSCYRYLIKDYENDIDYLFVHDYLALSTVIDTFDCSLNKGCGCPITGVIIPPDLDTFTYTGTNKDRFSRFYRMYLHYMESK